MFAYPLPRMGIPFKLYLLLDQSIYSLITLCPCFQNKVLKLFWMSEFMTGRFTSSSITRHTCSTYSFYACLSFLFSAELFIVLCRHVLKVIHLKRYRGLSSYSGSACILSLGKLQVIIPWISCEIIDIEIISLIWSIIICHLTRSLIASHLNNYVLSS